MPARTPAPVEFDAPLVPVASPGPDDVSRLGGLEGQRVVDYLLERSSFERACGNAGRHELEDLPLNFDEGDLAEIGRAVAKAGGGENEAKKPTAAVGRSRSTQSSIEFAVYGSTRTAGPAGEVASGGGASGGDGANAAAVSAEEGTPEAKKETIAEMRKRELRELHQDLVGLNRECEALKEGMQAKVESIREAEAEILRLHGEVRGLSGEHSVWKESVAIATAAAEEISMVPSKPLRARSLAWRVTCAGWAPSGTSSRPRCCRRFAGCGTWRLRRRGGGKGWRRRPQR